MRDLGSDFDRGGGDIGTDMRLLISETDKIRGWLQALGERLQCPRGAVWYDRDYGLDMRSYISDDEDPAVAEHEISQECKKDERTARCTTTITVQRDGSWSIRTVPELENGKAYELVFRVTAATIDILSQGIRAA